VYRQGVYITRICEGNLAWVTLSFGGRIILARLYIQYDNYYLLHVGLSLSVKQILYEKIKCSKGTDLSEPVLLVVSEYSLGTRISCLRKRVLRNGNKKWKNLKPGTKILVLNFDGVGFNTESCAFINCSVKCSWSPPPHSYFILIFKPM
jgi:hypothetical protein